MNAGRKALAILLALIGLLFVFVGMRMLSADTMRDVEESRRWLGAIVFAAVGMNMTIPCVGYLFKARWVRWAVLVPLLFFELGCLSAAYGFFLTSDISPRIVFGVGGIVLAAVSLGYFFKAKWARFIAGTVATLFGLLGLIGGIIAGFRGAFLGSEVAFILLFGSVLLLMLLWGVETVVRVFREDFRLLSRPAGSGPSLPRQQYYQPRSVGSIKLAERDKGEEERKLQELEEGLMPFHQMKVNYVEAVNTKNQAELDKLVGAIVLCESCSKGIRVRSARQQDSSLVCPYCGVKWISGDDLSSGV
jgi:MFS family permease